MTIDYISVIIITKNEQAGLHQTLQNLAKFSDVIIVDSNSTDRTPAIARTFKTKLVNFDWDKRYPKKKQWSLENAGAKNDWILLLDADEYPTESLIEELAQLQHRLAGSPYGAYDIDLSYRFCGKILKYGHRVTKRSLIHKDLCSFPVFDDLTVASMGEVEGHYQPESSLPAGRLRARLVHDDRDPISSWFNRHNKYSDWEAHLRQDENLRRAVASRRTAKGKVFDRIPGKPVMFFLYSYILKQGFRDGRAGFDYSVALATYYWQIGLKQREIQRGVFQ